MTNHRIPDVHSPQPPSPEDEAIQLTDPRPEVDKFTPSVLTDDPNKAAVEIAQQSSGAQRGAVEADSPGDPTNVNRLEMGAASTLDDTGGDPTEEIPGG